MWWDPDMGMTIQLRIGGLVLFNAVCTAAMVTVGENPCGKERE
jgi:hypothetical protein